MNPAKNALFAPSILLVDDEAQIHASLRLRLGRNSKVVSTFCAADALAIIAGNQYDLCIVDIEMPGMDGLSFIEEAKRIDPGLGFVVFSCHDTEDNLRRAIPLQVYEFVPKPISDRARFEKAVPEWVDRTRQRRREIALSRSTAEIARELESSILARDIEQTASAAAREALKNTAGMLSTAQALLANASSGIDDIAARNPQTSRSIRTIQEARKQVEQASLVTESYFTSAYSSRETSPAIVDLCAADAIAIAIRAAKAEDRRVLVEYQPLGQNLSLSSISGVDYLMLLTPVIAQAIGNAPDSTTVRVSCEQTARLEQTFRDGQRSTFLWINRRNAEAGSPGVVVTVSATGPAPDESECFAWFRGESGATLNVPSRGLVHGIIKAKGVAGIATRTVAEKFCVVVALPC